MRKLAKIVILVLAASTSIGCKQELDATTNLEEEGLLYESYRNNLNNVFDYFESTNNLSEKKAIFVDYLTGVSGLSLALSNKTEKYTWISEFLCEANHKIEKGSKIYLPIDTMNIDNVLLQSTLQPAIQLNRSIISSLNIDCIDNIQGLEELKNKMKEIKEKISDTKE